MVKKNSASYTNSKKNLCYKQCSVKWLSLLTVERLWEHWGKLTQNPKRSKIQRNSLADKIPVEMKWIMSHKGITGNEIADRAAKAGSKLRPTIITTQSKASIKQRVNDVIYEQWVKQWTEQKGCRQTKIFFPHFDRGKSKKIMSLNKAQRYGACLSRLA